MSAELENNQGLLDAALEISARRSNTLREIRELFLSGRDREATQLTKKFLGCEGKDSSSVTVRFPRPAPDRRVK